MVNVAFVRGVQGAGLDTINTDASQSEAVFQDDKFSQKSFKKTPTDPTEAQIGCFKSSKTCFLYLILLLICFKIVPK